MLTLQAFCGMRCHEQGTGSGFRIEMSSPLAVDVWQPFKIGSLSLGPAEEGSSASGQPAWRDIQLHDCEGRVQNLTDLLPQLFLPGKGQAIWPEQLPRGTPRPHQLRMHVHGRLVSQDSHIWRVISKAGGKPSTRIKIQLTRDSPILGHIQFMTVPDALLIGPGKLDQPLTGLLWVMPGSDVQFNLVPEVSASTSLHHMLSSVLACFASSLHDCVQQKVVQLACCSRLSYFQSVRGLELGLLQVPDERWHDVAVELQKSRPRAAVIFDRLTMLSGEPAAGTLVVILVTPIVSLGAVISLQAAATASACKSYSQALLKARTSPFCHLQVGLRSWGGCLQWQMWRRLLHLNHRGLMVPRLITGAACSCAPLDWTSKSPSCR